MLVLNEILLIIFVTLITSNPGNSNQTESYDIRQLWLDCRLTGEVSYDVFKMAVSGCREINNIKKKEIVTIIDFSKPSTEKRFFVIDIEKKQVLFRSFVAHGKNSGDNYAKDFSNKSLSLKSSLGFFLTAETYAGKHGYSLRLVGLEEGINDNAREREIVIHGADYVSQQFIDKNGRLGRSWGCPALPLEISKEVINKISNGSCLFIYAPDKFYQENTVFIN
jgi:hypothetical protein